MSVNQNRAESEAWEQKVERLRRIWRGQENYCGGDNLVQARRYYFKHLFEQTVRRAYERTFGDRPPRPVYLLISLLGYSPETTLLVFELLRPKRLLVITNREAEEELELLHEHLICRQKLTLARFERRNHDAHDPLTIFRIIEERLNEQDVKEVHAQARCEENEETRSIPVVVDITGGKKVMGVAAALAAWEFDVVPCYLDGDEYDREMRRPVPGTERLLFLDQAMSRFGGQEMEAALRLYRAGAFGAAYEQFRRLADRIAYPERARLFRNISELYDAWCNLDMDKLRECAAHLKQQVERATLPILHAHSRALRQQLSFLDNLTQHEPDSLVLNHYLLGLHYQETLHYDFSALLFYRTIEGCLIRRLEKRNPNFNPRRPDYSLLGNPGELTTKYRQIVKQVYSDLSDLNLLPGLPYRVSLMDAALLLYALEDEFIIRANLNTAVALGSLRQLTEIRNQSVLAHGYKSISKEDCEQLQQRAKHFLATYWKLTYPEEDLEIRLEQLRFLRELQA